MTSTDLKNLRAELGLTQYQMAALIQVPHPTYKNWEYGISEPPAEIDRTIAMATKDVAAMAIEIRLGCALFGWDTADLDALRDAL